MRHMVLMGTMLITAGSLVAQSGYDVSGATIGLQDVTRALADPHGFVRPLSAEDEKTIPKVIQVGDQRYPAVLAHGLLVREIDSWNTKVGERTTAKISQPIIFPDGMVIPKGSMLTGVVEEVATHGHGVRNSGVVFRFDSILLKDKTQIPVVARLVQARQPQIATSTSVGMPGAAPPEGSTPLQGAGGEGFYRVLAVGSGGIVAVDSDLQMLQNTSLTFLLTRASVGK